MIASAPLFEITESNGGFRDPSFGRNREIPLHRWVPWVAGFSAEFVRDSLREYLPTNGTERCVLDPFAGVGTTLLEAYVQGCDVVGFEINPYAALACNVKLNSITVPVHRLANHLENFEKFIERTNTLKREPRFHAPEGFKGRTELFSPKVQRKVRFALEFVHSIQETPIQNIFLLAFGSVMISFSNYSYEPSLTRRVSVGKPEIEDEDVGKVVATKLRTMLHDIETLQEHVRNSLARPKTRIVLDSILSASKHLRREQFVDLVVTSPPYLNNYHYPRNTRPQLHWLGLGNGSGYASANEGLSFGKFWQTVRGCEHIALRFSLPELAARIERIRASNTEKGAYGGPGWANYAVSYFNDTFDFCNVLKTLLKPGCRAVIVLGNSVIQGTEVPTDQYFGQIAELCGLQFETTLLLRKKRTGSSIIQSSVRVDKAPAKAALYESAIVLRN